MDYPSSFSRVHVAANQDQERRVAKFCDALDFTPGESCHHSLRLSGRNRGIPEMGYPAVILGLRIEKSVFGGEGLAFHDGKTVFVENALPGERVEARVLAEKKDWSRARTTKVLQGSPARIEPHCRHYGRCGGCQYQHVDYPEELRMKESQFREVLGKLAGIHDRVSGIVRGKHETGYRRSATFQVLREKRSKRPALAYVSKDNVTPLPIQSCDLLHPALARVLEGTPAIGKDTKKISFKISQEGKVHQDEKEVFFPVTLSGQRLLVSSQAFFQNNWEVTELMSKKIEEAVSQLRPKIFFDLYAGVGTFTFLCAKNIPKIVCVEENPHAVAALRMNREELGWSQVEVHEGRVERVFEGLWSDAGAPDAVIFLDPPRQGLDKKLSMFLAGNVQAKALLYVSCDPATLARDLKGLLGAGNWKLDEIIPYDMFPRTKHIEAVAFLTRGND